jgi:hypothetical protein
VLRCGRAGRGCARAWLTSSSANIGRWVNIRRAPAVRQPPTRSILFSATGPIRRPMPKGRSPNRWQAIESRPPHGAACHSAESHRRRRRRCCASVCDGLQRTRRGGERAAHICVGLARICAGTRSHLRRNSAALPQQCAALSRAPRPCVSPARARGPPARPTVPHVDSRDEPLEFVNSYLDHSPRCRCGASFRRRCCAVAAQMWQRLCGSLWISRTAA